MKKLLLMLGICIVLVSFAYAQDETYPVNNNISIQKSCFNNGTFCSAATQCNLTLFKVNSNSPVVLVSNQEMTNQLSFYNYTVTADNLSELGLYKYNIMCCDVNLCDFNSFEFILTPSGAEGLTDGQGNILFGSMLFILVLAIIFFVAGFKSEHKVLKVAGISLGCIMILILVLFTLLIMNEAIATSPKLVEGFETFYTVLKSIGTVLILLLMVVLIMTSIRAWKIKRGLIDR